jgi:hypothetical protein
MRSFTFARAFLVICVPFIKSQGPSAGVSRRRGGFVKKRRVMG